MFLYNKYNKKIPNGNNIENIGKINWKLYKSAINPPNAATSPDTPNIKKKFIPKTTERIFAVVISLIIEFIRGWIAYIKMANNTETATNEKLLKK